jgi:tRNA threonylcarbamoyladenosine biosynthesis protein TsaB
MTAILAIDCATGPTGVAVYQNGKVRAYLENPQPVMQSSMLLPMIEEVMAQSGLSYDDFSAIACTVGPGSFTGIRIGLGAARGIGFAAHIQVVGYTTLMLMAYAAQAEDPNDILVMLNAGKGEVYYQAFGKGLKALAEPGVATVQQAASEYPALRIISNIALEGIEAQIRFPRAEMLAPLALTHPDLALPASPYYIRPPDAKLPAKP